MLRLLMLDDEPSRHERAADLLVRCCRTHCYTPEAFAKAIRENVFDVILMDHDLGCEMTGADCVSDNLAYFNKAYVIVHSVNKPGADDMLRRLKAGNIPCHHMPFSSKALFADLRNSGF